MLIINILYYIHINLSFVEYHSQYYESNIKRSQLFGYYDMSNVMHYGLYVSKVLNQEHKRVSY